MNKLVAYLLAAASLALVVSVPFAPASADPNPRYPQDCTWDYADQATCLGNGG